MVAAHKAFQMPQDKMYLPIHVGNILHQDLKLGYQSDAEGENISSKNPYFCELTALYWGWKNLKTDYVGLAHYRRHFSCSSKGQGLERVMQSSQASAILSEYDVILPSKRRYYIESVYAHYAHTHDASHLDITREVIKNRCPEYLASFDKIMKRKSAHMFNMLVMKKMLYDSYCNWLFDILFDIEGRIDVSKMSSFDARLFGRISELLLDVWLDENKVAYKEVGYVQIGDKNTFGKICGFIKSKYFKKKYTASK